MQYFDTSSDKIGLYIHIPFCKSKCLYCNFFSVAGLYDGDTKEQYLNAIIEELKIRKDSIQKKIIDTIYIGGGTPSYISHSLYEDFFEKLFKLVDYNDVKELTIELNPDDIDYKLINTLKKIKNIRLSVGIQSLDNNILKAIGRNLDREKIINALDIIDNSLIERLSLDFIVGLPLSNVKSSADSIETLLKKYRNIEHVSLYYLELDDRDVLANKWKDILPKNNREIEEHQNACDVLKAYNFYRYEISSFALSEDSMSKHNMHYWALDDYLALGVGACGCINNVRYKNTKNINKYIESFINNKLNVENIDSITEERNKLTVEEREREFIFLSLRKMEGIDLDRYYNLFEVSFLDKYSSVLDKKKEYLNTKAGRIFIKEEFINFTDEISILFF